MAELIKVVAVQDDSSHWYIIPQQKKELFHSMIENSLDNDDWEGFEIEFGKYMTAGDLNLIQLYAEI
jgi:hypothetical protein